MKWITESWDETRYIEEHIKNIKCYVQLILKKILPLYKKDIPTNKLLYSSVIDSIYINWYWLAEKKNVKNCKVTCNVNNPFYIWGKMFDSQKHPNRQIEISGKIQKFMNNAQFANNKAPILLDLDEFVNNLKTNDEDIDNNTYFDLYIKFIQPSFIEHNDMSYYGIENGLDWSLKNVTVFWHLINNFCDYLLLNIAKQWCNIWNEFENSEKFVNEIAQIWTWYSKMYKESFKK